MADDPELADALVAAFPPTPITIQAADPRWEGYEARGELVALDGKAWTELSPVVLEQHAALLVHAGGALYRAIVPAYLKLVAEGEYATILPFHVISQLTRNPDSAFDRAIFDERVAGLTVEQRAVIRRALAAIAQQSILRDVASAALRSWD